MNPKVDKVLAKETKWFDEMQKLRTIAQSCGLTEELKWGVPCYTFEERNIVLIHGFKEYCALLFFKGSLMADPDKILIQQTKNVQAGRQIRFTDLNEIKKLQKSIKSYIFEAIELEKSGAKVKLKEASEFNMPDEFKQILKANTALKKAFYQLTPGRQKGYLLFFSQAKQSKTREARVQKFMKNILAGKGLND